MFSTSSFKFPTIAAAALLASVQVSGAATVTTKVTSSYTCTYSTELLSDATLAGVSRATDCAQPVLPPGGNTTVALLNDQELFMIDDWAFQDKFDLPATLGGMFEITATSDRRSGTWSLLDGVTFAAGQAYALALKAGNESFVYLLDTGFTSGTWSTFDFPRNPQGMPAGLSNISLYGTIPLPATGWLMLGVLGLGGVVAHRKRKQKAA